MSEIMERAAHIVDDSWMQTFSGKAFNIFEPDPDAICIEDIAHALSLKCRFNGHCKTFYSVAQHSALVCQNMPWHTHTPIARVISVIAKQNALLHDVVEAYLPDVARPLKGHLTVWTPWGNLSFRSLESQLFRAICNALDAGPHDLYSDGVKLVDDRMLATEQRDLMNPSDRPWSLLVEPYEEEIIPWPPNEAERAFIDFYRMWFERDGEEEN